MFPLGGSVPQNAFYRQALASFCGRRACKLAHHLTGIILDARRIDCMVRLQTMRSIFRVLVFRALTILLTVSLMPFNTLSQVVHKPAARHVIICVDGVGISTITKMRANGHFKSFRDPSHMISTFPSLTNAALTKILEPAGATMTGGYEDNFFDAEAKPDARRYSGSFSG